MFLAPLAFAVQMADYGERFGPGMHDNLDVGLPVGDLVSGHSWATSDRMAVEHNESIHVFVKHDDGRELVGFSNPISPFNILWASRLTFREPSDEPQLSCYELGTCRMPTCEELGTCKPPPCVGKGCEPPPIPPSEIPEPNSLFLIGSSLIIAGASKFRRNVVRSMRR